MRYEQGDVKWSTTDPLERSVVYLESIESDRAPKHAAKVEKMDSQDVKGLIEKPSRIDSSADPMFSETRDIYYRYESAQPLKYSRAVVDFSDEDGVVISWSRYPKPVSSSGTKYLNPRNNS